MIEFWIADLQSSEKYFSIPCKIGSWEFNRREDYEDLVQALEKGRCAPTFYASNSFLTRSTSDEDFDYSLGELIDICLILSFYVCMFICGFFFMFLVNFLIEFTSISNINKRDFSKSDLSKLTIKGADLMGLLT